jgi:hypothetical protein
MKQIFFTPQYPDEPKRGMGYIEIDEKFVNQIGIRPVYWSLSYGGFSDITAPDGSKFTAYCDNPYGFGGRNKRRFTVHSHEKVILLVAQKKLTIDAVLHFVCSWADSDAKVITPGKRTINVNKTKAQSPGYVYFVFNPDSDAIKIGIAKNVPGRLNSLQTSNAAKLELLALVKVENIKAARELEQYLHQQFAEFSLRGEWFKSNPQLLEYIHNKNLK